MSHLRDKLYTNKNIDCLSSLDIKKALDNIHKDFVVVPIDKATGNIDGNIRDLKIKFGIDNIPIENHRLPNMY